jgi:hypothetical protein
MTENYIHDDIKPMSVMCSIAEYFYRDASDFSDRFDVLWEHGTLMHKMGRVKSFVDLMMGCECALKAHCFLGRLNDDPFVIYPNVRGMSHSIEKLADYANFLHDRSVYRSLQSDLSGFSVFFRYSLDADRDFFPSLIEHSDRYSKSIGSNAWVLSIRENLRYLIDTASPCFRGFIADDFELLSKHDEELKRFAENCLGRGPK